MRKKLAIVGIVAVIVLVAVPTMVFAQTGRGTGTVYAEGDGTAGLRGDGWVRISGDGILLIRDRAGDAVIEVTGEGTRTERGSTVYYRGFNGEAFVEGSAITVGLRGENIVLEAEGTGVVYLRGEGTYEFNGQEGEWAVNGTTLRIDPAGVSVAPAQ